MKTEKCDIDLMECNVELMRCTGAEKAASTIVFMSKVSEMNDVEQLRQLVMHIMKGTIRYISNISEMDDVEQLRKLVIKLLKCAIEDRRAVDEITSLGAVLRESGVMFDPCVASANSLI